MKQIPTQALFVGQKVNWLPQCQSTNAVAMDALRAARTPEGYLVGTDNQTEGKGQRGNTWTSEPGANLTVSIVLKPQMLLPAQQFYLSMAMALAVRDTVAHYMSHQVTIKWPNDIYVANRKIAGLLIETMVQGNKLAGAVVGIGLNINQLEGLPEFATSLMMLTGHTQSLEEVLGILCHKVEQYYLLLRQQTGWGRIKQLYMDSLLGYGKLRTYKIARNGDHFSAILTDVLPSGKVILTEPDGLQHTFDIKELVWVW